MVVDVVVVDVVVVVVGGVGWVVSDVVVVAELVALVEDPVSRQPISGRKRIRISASPWSDLLDCRI